MGVVIVIDQGNFHIEDNVIEFTCTKEWAHLPKPPKSRLIRSVDFIRGQTFWNCTNSKSLQNSLYIFILHISVTLSWTDFELKNQMLQLGFDTLYTILLKKLIIYVSLKKWTFWSKIKDVYFCLTPPSPLVYKRLFLPDPPSPHDWWRLLWMPPYRQANEPKIYTFFEFSRKIYALFLPGAPRT